MLDIEAAYLQRYRDEVVLPQAERRASLERELSLLRRAQPPKARRSPVRMLGAHMLHLAGRLGAGRTRAAGTS